MTQSTITPVTQSRAAALLRREGAGREAAMVLLDLAFLGPRRRDLAALTVDDVVGCVSATLASVPRPRVCLRVRRGSEPTIWFEGKDAAWIARRARSGEAGTPLFPSDAFDHVHDALCREIGADFTWAALRRAAADALLEASGNVGAGGRPA